MAEKIFRRLSIPFFFKQVLFGQTRRFGDKSRQLYFRALIFSSVVGTLFLSTLNTPIAFAFATLSCYLMYVEYMMAEKHGEREYYGKYFKDTMRINL